MKKLVYLTLATLVISACSAPQPKPCDALSMYPSSAPTNPCGPEIAINKTWDF